MKHLIRFGFRFAVAAVSVTFAAAAWAQSIDVYKLDSCDCCAKWVAHLRSNGFTPVVHEVKDLDPIKQKLGVPKELTACHTAMIDGYVMEGHVPADLIHKFLKEHPRNARGLAVPGMPAGSPGMEGVHQIDYEVLLVKQDGSYATYAKR